MFRPAGFRPFLGTSMFAITDRALPAMDVLGPEVAPVERAVAGAGTQREMVAQAGVRQLQRRFADHVGVHPKAVIRRYRIYDAAERARRQDAVDWAALAVELGYSDQAHFTRDFSSAIGVPPERYAQLCRR